MGVCIMSGPQCSDGGRTAKNSSRCRAHGGRNRKPRGGHWGAPHQHYRKQVLAEAGCVPGTGIGGRCALDGRPGTPDDPLQADHIVPVALGGKDEPGNYRAVHRSENIANGVKVRKEIARRRREETKR